MRETINVEIFGTATTDAEDRTTASTTNIKGNNYVGGITGYTNQKIGSSYNSAKAEPNLNIDGIVVSGLQNMGGALGGITTNMYHITVKNTLVQTRDEIANVATAYSYVGGLVGVTNHHTSRGLLVDNVVVDVDNTNYVGGLGGYYRHNSQHCFVNNCLVKANKTSTHSTTLFDVGGLAGRYENNMNYNGVMNTIVDAPKHKNVGGVVGRFCVNLTQNYSVGNCYYLAAYDTQKELQYNGGTNTRYTAKALSKYYVKGLTNVGGIVGYQNSGYVHQSYSNANVIAQKNGYAGGLIGMYCNEYTTTLSNGKTNYSYAITGLYRNYFAGSVEAQEGYAGGAIGRTGMLQCEAKGNDGVLYGSRIKGVNANCNEVDKTYGNFIIADEISGGEGNTGAFASDDADFTFNGRDNRVWDKTLITNDSTTMYVGQILNNGNYAYDYWTGLNSSNKPNISTPAKYDKIQIFESTDLDGSEWIDKQNRSVVFYRTLDWLKYSSKENEDFLNRDTYWRISIGEVELSDGTIRSLYDKYEDTGNTGTYLPQVREKASGTGYMYSKDTVIEMQESVCRLPLPRDQGTARTLNLTSGYSMRAIETTYGVVYPVDVNKINVEFSNDLVDAGYFTLKAGDTVIANKVITQRTYTFTYPYNQNITFEYGFLTDTSLEEDKLLSGTNYDELESVLLGPNDLKTDIMVYHNDYYYISEEGLVSSVGTWLGDFVHVMNGKVLDTNGDVWNVETRKKVSSVNSVALQKDASPLWKFQYGNFGIDTYARYSAIESEYDYIYRNSQIFVVNDELFTVDGTLETRKTDILIYKLNGETYQTVLGNDGMMVDMMQDDWNIPEEVDNQAIVRISNTMNASVPYVLVEYNNGGIIGYNYATGEILFDNSITNPVSLLDYALDFFGGEKTSQYANISNTYTANKNLSDSIHSSADLEKIIGNSSGEVITGNEYTDNSSPAQGAQNMADSNYAKEGDGTIGVGDSVTGQGSNGEKPDGTDNGEDGTFVTTTETSPEDATKSSDGEEMTDGKGMGDGSKEKDAKDDKDTEAKEENQTDIEDEKEETDEENTEDDSSEKTDTSSETDVNSDEDSEGKENTENHPKVEDEKQVGSGEFMTVYNNETGVYEIVSVADYLTVDAYISENYNLGIKDLSKQVSGYAQATVDVNQERGIIMYVIPILIIFGIAGIIVIYVKRKERKV